MPEVDRARSQQAVGHLREHAPPISRRLVLENRFFDRLLVVHAADDVHLVVDDSAGRVEEPEGHRRKTFPSFLARLRGQTGVRGVFPVRLEEDDELYLHVVFISLDLRRKVFILSWCLTCTKTIRQINGSNNTVL